MFCSAIIRVQDLVSTINHTRKNEGNKATIKEICELCDQMTRRIIQSIEEENTTNMIENEVRALTRSVD
ncbi:hypothetical protein FRC03_007459 [Tulasnella sp. 419]|nr:hypothetical protein FRC03_007459 [Tulasnella sp. 419]